MEKIKVTNYTYLNGFGDPALNIEKIYKRTYPTPEEGSIEERVFLNKILKELQYTNFNGPYEPTFSALQEALAQIDGDGYKSYISKKYGGQRREDVEIELASGNSIDFIKYFVSRVVGLRAGDSITDVEFLWINSDEYRERSEAIVENNRLMTIVNEKRAELTDALANVEKLKRQIAYYEKSVIPENVKRVNGR